MINQIKKEKKKRGQPSKYLPEYCQKIVEYFDIEPYREVVTKRITSRAGDVTEEIELRANDLRFFSGFARSIGVSQESLFHWNEAHPDFFTAFKKAKELQQEHLITNGLQDTYAQAFAIFTAKNIMGWRDRTEIQHSGNLSLEGIMSHVQDASTKDHGRLAQVSGN